MANGLQGLFGGSAASGGLTLYPAIFPVLFGNGAAGAATLGTIADGGYLGSFGAPQYTSATLPAGASITLPPGSSNGGLLIACQGVFTLGGSIIANGGAGGNAAAGIGGTAIGGAGGATAGGGQGAAATTAGVTNGTGLYPGSAPTQFGHGCLPNTSRGAGAGSYGDGTVTSASVLADTNFALPIMDMQKLVKCSPVPTTSAVVVAQSGSMGAPQVTARTIPSNLLYSGSALQSFALLPSGLCGMAGALVATNFCATGGGGGGGGLVYIEANTIVFQAGHSIQANGGNGGNALALSGGGSYAQGGCGGDGGLVILVANQFVGTPNVSVNGGAAGTNASNTPSVTLASPLASLPGRFVMIQV